MKKVSFDTFAQLLNGRKNFAGLELTGHDLSGLDLTGAIFDRATAIEVDFDQADLSGASFQGANLGFAKMPRVNATGAAFSGPEAFPILGAEGNFSRCTFRDLGEVSAARFRAANFQNARFENIRFTNCHFAGADFRGATFSNVTVDRCDFAGARFAGADLGGFSFPLEAKSPLLNADTRGARNYFPWTLTMFLDTRDRLKAASKGPELEASKGISAELVSSLENLREMAGLTQAEFAQRIALAPRTYQDWLTHPGRFSKLKFRQFVALAEKLNYNPTGKN